MEHVSDQWWARIESVRYRMKSLCFAADKAEFASIVAEIIELRDFVWAFLRQAEDETLPSEERL